MNTLLMWTIYDHPTDFPEGFIARQWTIYRDGSVRAGSAISAPNIETLRYHFEFALGLSVIRRSPGDDSKIIESWM